MIDAAHLAVDEIAGKQCSIINLQYAVKKMEFFGARMPVSWIIGSGIKPDQHAHAIVFRVPGEYLDVDTWRRFFPLWFKRRVQRRYERLRVPFAGDSLRQPAPQRFRGAQHIGGPADKRANNRPERLDFVAAILA